MTYTAFLAFFLLGPSLVAAALVRTLHVRGRRPPASLRPWPALPFLAGHAFMSVLYTAPWDNYLVAAQVWWYDPRFRERPCYRLCAARGVCLLRRPGHSGRTLDVVGGGAGGDRSKDTPAASVSSTVVDSAGRLDQGIRRLPLSQPADRRLLSRSGAGLGRHPDSHST